MKEGAWSYFDIVQVDAYQRVARKERESNVNMMMLLTKKRGGGGRGRENENVFIVFCFLRFLLKLVRKREEKKCICNYIITSTELILLFAFFYLDGTTICGHFLSTWKSSFSIYCKMGLLATHYFNFFFIWNVFFSHLLFGKICLLHVVFLVDIFSLNTLNMPSSLHCFWW